MSKRLDGVLGFCTQHRYAFPMLAKLGQDCWKTVSAAGISVVWRRVPITTATIVLVVGFWLYDYTSVSSAATASAATPVVAAASVPAIATQLLSTQPLSTEPLSTQKFVPHTLPAKKAHRTHHAPHPAKTAHSAFRRKRVGQNEVDYVAPDVTVRLFTPEMKRTPTPVARSGRQRQIGKDVTVRYFEPERRLGARKPMGSTVAQSAER